MLVIACVWCAGTYETKVLENTLRKIVDILRLGFGAPG